MPPHSDSTVAICMSDIAIAVRCNILSDFGGVGCDTILDAVRNAYTWPYMVPQRAPRAMKFEYHVA